MVSLPTTIDPLACPSLRELSALGEGAEVCCVDDGVAVGWLLFPAVGDADLLLLVCVDCVEQAASKQTNANVRVFFTCSLLGNRVGRNFADDPGWCKAGRRTGGSFACL